MPQRTAKQTRDATGVRAPSQVRSRASMEALLEIGRRLIQERGIDNCSMNDVAEAAGSSIGALYFRFGNREGFVSAVMERQIDQAARDFERVASALRASADAPAEIVSGVVGWLVRNFAENQGLLRAQLRRSLEAPQVWRPFQDLARIIISEAIGLLSRFPQIEDDPDWELHVRVVMQMTIGTLNNILINNPGPLELSDPRTSEELGVAAIRYLRLDDVDTSLPG